METVIDGLARREVDPHLQEAALTHQTTAKYMGPGPQKQQADGNFHSSHFAV